MNRHRAGNFWLLCSVMTAVAPWTQAHAQGDNEIRNYAQEYVHSFKAGAENRAAFVNLGPDAEKCVKFDAEGLRITLPAGFQGTRPSTGVVSVFGLKGDFEITLRYELLAEPEQTAAGPQTRFAVSVSLNRA